jgi:hypothetical protein
MSLLGIRCKKDYTTVEDLLQSLVSIVIELGIDINFAHLEAIVYSMIRDPSMIIHRPKEVGPGKPYAILPTCSAITYSRALSTALAFERIGVHLKNVYTYLKDSTGFLDPFFK